MLLALEFIGLFVTFAGYLVVIAAVLLGVVALVSTWRASRQSTSTTDQGRVS